MSKKYHFFISSTLDDLKNERQELGKLIFELGHIPLLMDSFDRNVKYDWDLVRKNIEDADYCIVLCAHHYAMADDGSSFLEKEFAHAVKKQIPVIALIIDEGARWKKSKIDDDPAAVKALGLLKKKLSSHPHEYWTGSQDMLQKAQKLIIHGMNINPAPGWVRAGNAVEPALANEIARLSGENAELNRQIRVENAELLEKLRDRMSRTLKILNGNGIDISFYYSPGENWENTRKLRYLRLFKLLVPELYMCKTTSALCQFIGTTLNPDLDRTVRKDYPVPSNTLKKIMSDLELLRIVRCTGGEGGDECWELTEYGKELYHVYRLRQMRKGGTPVKG